MPFSLFSALELRDENKENRIARLNYSRSWLMAFHLFARENKGQIPASFDQALSFLPTEARAETNLTTEQFEIVYQGALTNIANPASTIVIREKEAWSNQNGGWARAYAFADGHSEVH